MVAKKKSVKKVEAKKKEEKEIVVYGTPTCPWCHKARDFLDEHKIKYVYKDVSSDYQAADEILKKTGQMSVPVIDVYGTLVVGFEEIKLRELLKIKD